VSDWPALAVKASEFLISRNTTCCGGG